MIYQMMLDNESIKYRNELLDIVKNHKHGFLSIDNEDIDELFRNNRINYNL